MAEDPERIVNMHVGTYCNTHVCVIVDGKIAVISAEQARVMAAALLGSADEVQPPRPAAPQPFNGNKRGCS